MYTNAANVRSRRGKDRSIGNTWARNFLTTALRMEDDRPNGFQALIKVLIGWAGLYYFFLTNDEVWGEAVGLTLFFASGQLQTAVRPPFNGKLIGGISSDDLLEAWRIVIGVAPCVYYSYFVLYLGNSVSIYTSTICLSLLWESQIVDDLINLLSYWLSYDMVNSTKLFTKKILTMRRKPANAFARNLVQDFLCVLCKLYKHLLMNFTKMNCFLLSKVSFDDLTTKSIIENRLKKDSKMIEKDSYPNPVEKIGSKKLTKYLSSKVLLGTKKSDALISRIGIVGSNWKLNNGFNVRYLRVMPSIPATSVYNTKRASGIESIWKQGRRIPVF